MKGEQKLSFIAKIETKSFLFIRYNQRKLNSALKILLRDAIMTDGNVDN